MSFVDFDTVTITASSTAVSGFTKVLTGLLDSFEVSSAAMVSPTVTLETTFGISICTMSSLATSTSIVHRYPRVQVHSSTGGVLAYNSTVSDPASEVATRFPLAGERVKVTVTETTTASKSCTVRIKVV